VQAVNEDTQASRDLIAALRRAEDFFRRRPELGLHDDAPATARLEFGTRIATSHPNGTTISSDMPTELGGTGDRITPGWLSRAGLAACATTTIAMAAAAQEIELSALEVRVDSRTDTRGLLGMEDAGGERVSASPRDFVLSVTIAARGVAAERLRSVVDEGLRRSPVSTALQNSIVADLRISTGTD